MVASANFCIAVALVHVDFTLFVHFFQALFPDANVVSGPKGLLSFHNPLRTYRPPFLLHLMNLTSEAELAKFSNLSLMINGAKMAWTYSPPIFNISSQISALFGNKEPTFRKRIPNAPLPL